MPQKKSRLGRSLGSIITKGGGKKTPLSAKESSKASNSKKNPPEEKSEPFGFQELEVNLIEPNPYQPRKEMDQESLNELMQSIHSDGLLQPILVRKGKDATFELIAGQRRLAAFKKMGKETIPANVVEVNDTSSAIMSLIENLQRENLNPIEEGQGYASLINDFELTQDEAARRIGKPRASIANALRLLKLEPEIQGYLKKGLLSVGHAKIILSVESSEQRILLTKRILEKGLSVRDTETLIKQIKDAKKNAKIINDPILRAQSAVIEDLQKQIASHLNTAVTLSHSKKKGKLIIEYRGNEDLHRILQKIGFGESKQIFAA